MTKIAVMPQFIIGEPGPAGPKAEPALPDDVALWLKALDQPKRGSQPSVPESEPFHAPPREDVAQSIAEWLAKANDGDHPPAEEPKVVSPRKHSKLSLATDAPPAASPNVAVAALVLPLAPAPQPTPPTESPEPLPQDAPRALALPNDPVSAGSAANRPEAADAPAPLAVTVARQETHLPPASPLPSQISAAIVQHLAPLDATPASEPVAGPVHGAPAEPGPARPTQILTLQLDPPDLGTVDIRLRLTGQTLRVQIDAARPETLAILDRAEPSLRVALHSAGYQLDDVTIQSGSIAAPGVRASETLRLEPAPADAGSQTHDQSQNQNRSSDQPHAFPDSFSRGEGQNQRSPGERRDPGQRKPSGDRRIFIDPALRDGRYI